MKAIIFSFALLFGTSLLAQTNGKAVKPVKGSTGVSASSGTPSTGIAPACYLGKTWKLVKVEKFGVTSDPGPDQANDMLLLNADGTFKVILKGVEKTGTYTRGTWLNLKPADGSEAMPYKIISCESTIMKADWRDGDTHNNFFYKAQ